MSAPKSKKLPLSVLLGALIGLIVGYGAGRVSTGTPVNPLSIGSDRSGSYQDGYDAARKKIADAHVFGSAPTEALTVVGTVKSVGKDSIVVEVDLRSPNPLEESTAPKERTVTISQETKISKQVPKSPEEMQKDMDAFQKAAASDAPPSAPPSPFKMTTIELSDLKAGDTVTLSADHDILHEASFAATSIELVGEAPALPSGGPDRTAPPAGASTPPGPPPPNGEPDTSGRTEPPPTSTP